MTVPTLARSGSLTEHLRPGDRVFAAGLTGESTLLLDELTANPQRAAGVEFTSVQLAGIDRADYLALHPEARARAFFMTPSIRRGIAERRAELHPLDYSGTARYLAQAEPYDSVIAQFSPPDSDGWCNPGLSADFAPLVWTRARRKVAHLNPSLPRIPSGFRVHVSEFDMAVEADFPALELPRDTPADLAQRIGAHAASLVRDGDTLQFGIGSVISAVAAALSHHRLLRVHSGMIAAFVEQMWDSGCMDRNADIVTGVAFGDNSFYERLGSDIRVRLEDVRHTHGIQVLLKAGRLTAVNSAVEVDLFGQVNSERSEGMIQAGAGGLPAFAHAAQLTPEGQLLICLPSSAKKGTVSRIVPSLSTGSLCTLPRHCADAVVTEYGVAQLRGLSLNRRAQALIDIAHPDHRDYLASEWEAVCRRC